MRIANNGGLVSGVSRTGVGVRHSVTVSLGFQRTTTAVTYSYDAALLRGVYTVTGLVALASGTHMPLAEARRANIGQPLTLVGDNFAQSTTMQCRFGTLVVQATFVNHTAVLCVPSAVASGELRVHGARQSPPTSALTYAYRDTRMCLHRTQVRCRWR